MGGSEGGREGAAQQRKEVLFVLCTHIGPYSHNTHTQTHP